MELNLKKMVIPFHCALFLKQRGMKQHSLFYWVKESNGLVLRCHEHIKELIIGGHVPDSVIPENACSAFLTDELYELFNTDTLSELRHLKLSLSFKGFQKNNLSLKPPYHLGTTLIEWLLEVTVRQHEKRRVLRDRKKAKDLFAYGERVPQLLNHLNPPPHGNHPQ